MVWDLPVHQSVGVAQRGAHWLVRPGLGLHPLELGDQRQPVCEPQGLRWELGWFPKEKAGCCDQRRRAWMSGRQKQWLPTACSPLMCTVR